MLSVVPQNDGEAAKVIDFREVAPLAASKDMFHENDSLASWVRIVTAVLHEHNEGKVEQNSICRLPANFKSKDPDQVGSVSKTWLD